MKCVLVAGLSLVAAGMLLVVSAAAAGLPEPARAPFVDGFAQAASGGLRVGAGQNLQALPAEVPPALADRISAAAQHTFAAALTDAMDPVILVAVGVVLVTGFAVLFVPAKGADAPHHVDHGQTAAIDASEGPQGHDQLEGACST